jgi:hypothetical protein
MQLKPTPRKIRLSLLAVGALLGYLSYEFLYTRWPISRPLFVFALVGAAMALIYVYMSFRLSRIMTFAARRVVGMTIAAAGWMLLAFAFSPYGGWTDLRGYLMFGAMVISWYMVHNLKKVTYEPAPGAPQAN